MHIAMVSPEICPFARTGGLGDVVGTLPLALEKLGLKVSLVMPAYRQVLQGGFALEDTGLSLSVPVSDRKESATVLKTRIGRGINVYFIKADKYFDRDGLYYDGAGDYVDNAERFVFFSRAALEALKPDPPQVLHAHDWQTALSVVFLQAQPEMYPWLAATDTVFTIHNIGYQGLFWNADWHLLNLDWRFFSHRYLEFYDKINFLKGGIAFADRMTTVSTTYAEENKTAEYGFGLEGILKEREKDLTGIINGVDYSTWNPETDRAIAATYSADDLAGKTRCKAELQTEYGLAQNPDVLLIGWASRLTSQKGCDILESALGGIMGGDVQFVMLGDGDKHWAEVFSRWQGQFTGKMGVHIGFNEELVHRMMAGCDLLLLPSRYEPCGLTQLYGLRYGTPSVVRATGGLKDTIQEFSPETKQGTGFFFGAYDSAEFLGAIDKALACYGNKTDWARLAKNCMKVNFSWDTSARAYRDLYQKLVQEEKQPEGG